MSSPQRVLLLSLSGLVAGTLASNLACKTDEGGVSEDEAAETIAEEACRQYYECECDTHDYSSEADCKLEVAGQIQEGIDRARELELLYDDSCPGIWISLIDAIGCTYNDRLYVDADLIKLAQDAGACKLFHGEQAAGDDCEDLAGDVGDDCDEESECIQVQQGQWECEAYDLGNPEGEDCTPYQDECEPGLVCVDINGGQDAICEDLPGAGGTCMGTADLCDINLYCDQESKTCAHLPGSGDPCAPGDGGLLSGTCDMESICDGDTCEDLPGDGEACPPPPFRRCADGFRCDYQDEVCVEDSQLACNVYVWG